MVRKIRYIKRKPYNTIIQIAAMRSLYPKFKCKYVSDSDITFTGDLLIKPELPIYRVSIQYRGAVSPVVKIISPLLVDNAPHVYEDKRLCLYHPKNYKWRKENLLVREIIPWTIAWIYFYEYWLETNLWVGPEVSHGEIKKEEDESALSV